MSNIKNLCAVLIMIFSAPLAVGCADIESGPEENEAEAAQPIEGARGTSGRDTGRGSAVDSLDDHDFDPTAPRVPRRPGVDPGPRDIERPAPRPGPLGASIGADDDDCGPRPPRVGPKGPAVR